MVFQVLCKLDMGKHMTASIGSSWIMCLVDIVLVCDGEGPRVMWKCYGSVSFEVLVNGSPTSYFGSSKGLKQGDPLSPRLFLLVVEPLKCWVECWLGQLKLDDRGFKVGNGSVQVSHVQYAEDTLIMCTDS